MSKSRSLQRILALANEKEKKYDWLSAVEFHEKALDQVLKQQDFLKVCDIEERIGYCFYRAAFQAETKEDFKKRVLLAVEAFNRGAELFERVRETETRAKIKHCEAMAAYVGSWLAADLSAKREQLDECWRLEKEALRDYGKSVDHMNVGKSCNNLMIFLTDRLDIEWNAESREKIVGEALKYGEKAIEIFAKAEDKHQLAQAYTLTAFFYRNAAFAGRYKAERREECRKKALDYPEKAIEISEEIGDHYLIGLSNFRLADAHLDILGLAVQQERQHYEKGLRCGILTKDNLLIAEGLWGLEFAAVFSAIAQENPDKAREEYRKLDEYREDVVGHCSIIGLHAWIAYAYCFGIWPIEQRSAMESNLKSKHLLIEDSVKLGYKSLEHAHLSGSMGVTFHVTGALGIALRARARVETNIAKKRGLLEESSKYTEESISILRQASACATVEPRESILAARIWSLALNQVELANTEKTVDEKTKMLKNAIANMQSSCEDWLEAYGRVEKPHWFMLGGSMMTIGKTLSQLYELNSDTNVLNEAIEVYEKSVEYYGKADSPFSRVAESYWQLAHVYSKIGNYTESARNFKLASESYMRAAEKIPQLKDFYQDYVSYMKAWNEIEKAKHHHAENHYGQAREHYEKAANLHKSTVRWNYLNLNYLALARLEEAEDLSRREQAQEARDIFQRAAGLFVEAMKSVKTKLEKIENEDEEKMATELVRASDVRREYCLGRIALEEAKILDRQGDHASSSRKYGFATEKFQKATHAMEHESDRKKLRPIVDLSRAWQMMTQAEAEASPDLYLEASKLFDQTKEHSVDEKAKILSLGHSYFCKALEAGTRFEATRDRTLYSTAKRHIEAATNYYLKAGFKTASEYAKATYRLFDAYMYTYKAQTETDPTKKAQFYQMAEKLLRASAGSYMKAKHPEKGEEVGRLLESVKEERQLAMSLTDVLHAPIIASTTTSFSTPIPTHEKAVGLERFEHADMQARVILKVREVEVGEDIDLEIELVNAGKTPASLIKVEEIIPEDFEVRRVPEIYRVEDRYLNMKGKRLPPLKTEEIRLVLRPTTKGTFSLKPRIIYVDETGRYKSHEPEPATITVKELGIKGWIKGER